MEQMEGPMCSQHDRLIEYFCQDDQVPICSRCYIMGEHKEHSIISFEEKNKPMIASIENEMETATIVLNKLSKINKTALKDKIMNEKKTLDESISKSFRHLQTVLNTREKAILGEVSTIFRNRLTVADGLTNNLRNEKQKLEKALQDSRHLIENQALVVIDGDSVLKTISNANRIPCVFSTGQIYDSQVKWIETHIEDIAEAICTFGIVSGDKEEAILLRTITEAPEEINEEDKVLNIPFNSQQSCDTQSISSVDTGEDVIIESDTESITSVATTMSSSSRNSNYDIVFPFVKGSVKHVNVTHIRSPNEFCVQLLLNKLKLDSLSRNMNVWANKPSSAKQVPRNVKKGMLLLGCYSADNQWYRARVIDVDVPQTGEGTVHVSYLDFGNEEKLPLGRLRSMQTRFQRYPPFCIRCSLYDIAPADNSEEWDNYTIQEFFRITQYQTLLLNVIAMKGSLYEVDLVSMPTDDTLDDSFTSVRDMLIFMELARFARPSQPEIGGKPGPRFKTVEFFKPTAVLNGNTIGVSVSEAISPSHLYITGIEEEYCYFLRMADKMQDVYESDVKGVYTMHCPRKNAVCACKGPDGKWYRGKIVSDPKCRKVTVFLTDTGSSLVLDFDKIRKLLSDFIKLPSQAILCKLADVGFTEEMPSDWSHDAKVWCQSDLKGSTGKARIVRWGEVTEIVLWSSANPQSINGLLVEAGLAVSTGISSIQSSPSAARTVGQNHKDPAENAAKEHSSNDASKRKSAEKKPLLSTPSSPSKDAAQNKSQSSPKSSVKETGGSAKKSKKGKKKKTKSESENASNAELSAETARKKKVQEDIQKAIDGGESGGKEESKGQESAYIEIIICYYKSPSDFCIRVQENEAVLIDLMDELNEEYKDVMVAGSPKTWNAAEFCVVRNPEDQLWYRAKVKSRISKTDLEVELLDYGQVYCVQDDDLRPLTGDFGTRLHSAAVRCHLSGIVPTGTSDRYKWSQTATEFMALSLHNRKLYITAKGDPTELGLPIDIILEEEIPETAFDPVTHSYHSLRQLIIDKGLAILDRPRKTPSAATVHRENPLRVLAEDETESESKSKEEESGYGKMMTPEMFEVPPYTIPDLNEEIEVIPTFIDYSGVIYVQRMDWDSQIAHLSEELQRVYQGSPEQLFAWSLGHVCVAQFDMDGMWYRGLIEETDTDKAKVFFMDFGNSAWMGFDKLREIHSSFAEYAVQVYHCVLEDLVPNTPDGQWPVALLDVMHEVVVNCPCVMVYTGMQDDGRLKIKLCKRDGFDMASHLLAQGYAVSTMDLKEQFANSKAIGAALTGCDLCAPPDVGGAGSVFKAMATEVELPNILYVQRTRLDDEGIHDFVRASEIAMINSELDQFENMMADINTTPSCGFVKLPEIGVMCLGKFHFDNQWYRALCVEKYPEVDSCLVTFIDYGTSEMVSKEGLRTLPTEFWNLPCQGIRCHLNLLPPGGPDAIWRKNSMDAMVTALAQKQLTVKVVQTQPLVVELFEETEGSLSLAYGEIIQKGLALLPMQVDLDVLLMGRDGGRRRQQGGGDVEVEEEEVEGCRGDKLKQVDQSDEGVNLDGNNSSNTDDASVNGNESSSRSQAAKEERDSGFVKTGKDCSTPPPSKSKKGGRKEGGGDCNNSASTREDGSNDDDESCDTEDGWTTASDEDDEDESKVSQV